MEESGCSDQMQIADMSGTDAYTDSDMSSQDKIELTYDMFCQKGKKKIKFLCKYIPVTLSPEI